MDAGLLCWATGRRKDTRGTDVWHALRYSEGRATPSVVGTFFLAGRLGADGELSLLAK